MCLAMNMIQRFPLFSTPKTNIDFENKKKLLESKDCHFQYLNLVEELPGEDS